MRLRNLDKIDYSETRRNREHGTARRGEPGTSTHPKAGKSTTTKQKRTASGRVTRTVSANAFSVTPKKSSRRSMGREHRHASPIVEIIKKTATNPSASAPSDSSDAEHHSILMHKFFKAHEDQVANVPRKKQRKALGKLWRESPLNPKNARAQHESNEGSIGNEDGKDGKDGTV
ncbi:atpase aaa [Diplodia corticola]|uniref:Atpase aaa n=1 Tax=Diplodia corticola TaxID=236234 RepID=A0A1J9QVM7_9PEZI|nr:atpase aaa [Diplodia corticola]OJD32464.1 atpase aaa [Diplodia corticola]